MCLRYGHHFCWHFHNFFFYVGVTSDCIFHFDIVLFERLNRVLMNVANRIVEKNRNKHATFINKISRLCRSLWEWGADGGKLRLDVYLLHTQAALSNS